MELVRIIILARNSSPPPKMNGIGQNYYISKKPFSPHKKWMELVRIIILARNSSSPPKKKWMELVRIIILARNSSPHQKMNGIGQNYYFSKKLFSPPQNEWNWSELLF